MSDMFRTNLEEVPHVAGLRRDEGWVDMRVQFLIDAATAGSDDFLLGWTVLPPGARHDRHLHENADEFFIVIEGEGRIYTNDGTEPAKKGDVVLHAAVHVLEVTIFEAGDKRSMGRKNG